MCQISRLNIRISEIQATKKHHKFAKFAHFVALQERFFCSTSGKFMFLMWASLLYKCFQRGAFPILNQGFIGKTQQWSKFIIFSETRSAETTCRIWKVCRMQKCHKRSLSAWKVWWRSDAAMRDGNVSFWVFVMLGLNLCEYRIEVDSF